MITALINPTGIAMNNEKKIIGCMISAIIIVMIMNVMIKMRIDNNPEYFLRSMKNKYQKKEEKIFGLLEFIVRKTSANSYNLNHAQLI